MVLMAKILGAILFFWLIGRFGANPLMGVLLMSSRKRLSRYIDLTDGKGPAGPRGQELAEYQGELLNRYLRIYGPWWMTRTYGCRCLRCTGGMWAYRLGLHGWWLLCHMDVFRKGFDKGIDRMLAKRWRVQ